MLVGRSRGRGTVEAAAVCIKVHPGGAAVGEFERDDAQRLRHQTAVDAEAQIEHWIAHEHGAEEVSRLDVSGKGAPVTLLVVDGEVVHLRPFVVEHVQAGLAELI